MHPFLITGGRLTLQTVSQYGIDGFIQDLPSLAQSIVLCVESNISAFGILVGLDIKYFASLRIDEVLVFVDEDLVPMTTVV